MEKPEKRPTFPNPFSLSSDELDAIPDGLDDFEIDIEEENREDDPSPAELDKDGAGELPKFMQEAAAGTGEGDLDLKRLKPTTSVEEKTAPKKGKKGTEESYSEKDYEDVEAASPEEVKKTPKRGDESDMNEDFDRFVKASLQGEKAMRKKWHEMEMRLHTADMSKKRGHQIWMSPLIMDLYRMIAAHMGVTIGEVVETAALMFYRNVISEENNMLNDLGFLLDGMALQIQELGMETDKLSDLAMMVLSSEYSPLDGSKFSEIASKDKDASDE